MMELKEDNVRFFANEMVKRYDFFIKNNKTIFQIRSDNSLYNVEKEILLNDMLPLGIDSLCFIIHGELSFSVLLIFKEKNKYHAKIVEKISQEGVSCVDYTLNGVLKKIYSEYEKTFPRLGDKEYDKKQKIKNF
jgi:hypothetical protein